MTDQAPPAEPTSRPPQPGRPPREKRPWLRQIAFAPLWLFSVLVLSLGIAAAATHLVTRRPDVVETIAPPPPPAELPLEVVRRAEAMRALNGALADQIDALRKQIEQPSCPPGTAIETTGGLNKSSFDEGAPRPPSAALPPSAPGPT